MILTNYRKVSNKLKLLYLLLISTLIVNFSMSRYMSTYNASTTGDAATWVFNINDQSTQTFTVNLANTTDADTTYDRTKNVIAPGAKGQFNIKIDCTGAKIAIDYQIVLSNAEESQMPSEIVFYTYNTDETKNVLISSDLGQTKTLTGEMTLDEINNSAIKTVTIYWQWQINKNIDESEYEGKDFYINATVTGTQKAVS